MNTVDVADILEMLEKNDLNAVREIKALITEKLNSNKDSWLLNIIVDSYIQSKSQACLDILALVTEPHDKHIFDMLVEHLRGTNKLAALSILSFLVMRQPSWIHQIVRHPLLSILLKCLKLETDVLVLMSGILTLTTLLPIVPVLIAPHLSAIFDVFTRLAAFCSNKTQHILEIYVVHLRVGVYCLFHRLYGMYPYHFISHLREVYVRHPNQQSVFDEMIQPMLQMVRMHPLLVTATKEKEISTERWKTMEVHDITVECARLSLDMIEGRCEEHVSCPLVMSGRTKATQSRSVGKQSYDQAAARSTSVGDWPRVRREIPIATATSTSAASFLQQNLLWSPSSLCGLSTPPPDGNQVPSSALPMQTGLLVPDSPLPGPHMDYEKARKRLADITLSMSGTVQRFDATDPPPVATADRSLPSVTQPCGVSPSPFRPNFTSQPPLDVQRMCAIRLLNFERDPETALEAEMGGGPKPPVVTHEVGSEVKMAGRGIEAEISGASSAGDDKVAAHDTLFEDVIIEEARCALPSMCEISSFINTLDVQADDADSEVSELTGSPQTDHSPPKVADNEDSPSHHTVDNPLKQADTQVKCVKEIMQCVNRIRFESLSDDATAPTTHHTVTHGRTSSCPPLPAPVPPPPAPSTVPQPTSSDANETWQCFPYQLFLSSLPCAPLLRCQHCMTGAEGRTETANTAAVEAPLFTTFSPSDLLDKHIQLGWEVHAKQLSHIPLTSHGSANWIHFGGEPPSDEISILRGEILLLHNQLMYERHKRQLYAKRNRRSLKHVVNTISMHEQNVAMRDQLRLQEQELVNMRQELQQQQLTSQQLLEEKIQDQNEKELAHKCHHQELRRFQSTNSELEEQLQSQRAVNSCLDKELQKTKSANFELGKELEAVRLEADRATILKEQVTSLNNELLLMSELQQKYRQRLVTISNEHCPKPELQFRFESINMELHAMKKCVEQKTLDMEAAKAKIHDHEENLKSKELMICDLKNIIQEQAAMFEAQMKAAEDKYSAQRNVEQRLRGEVLRLYHERKQPRTTGTADTGTTDTATTDTGTGDHTEVTCTDSEDVASAVDRSEVGHIGGEGEVAEEGEGSGLKVRASVGQGLAAEASGVCHAEDAHS